MTLKELVLNHLADNTVNYSNTEALYLSTPFTEDSEVRFGQPRFENGGLVDSKEFFMTNEFFTDRIDWYLDYDDVIEDTKLVLSELLIRELVYYLLDLEEEYHE